MAKMRAVSKLERQFTTLCLWLASTGGGGGKGGRKNWLAFSPSFPLCLPLFLPSVLTNPTKFQRGNKLGRFCNLGWFWRMCPHSGFFVASFRFFVPSFRFSTLIPVLVPSFRSLCPRSVQGTPPKPPFWKPPCHANPRLNFVYLIPLEIPRISRGWPPQKQLSEIASTGPSLCFGTSCPP